MYMHEWYVLHHITLYTANPGTTAIESAEKGNRRRGEREKHGADGRPSYATVFSTSVLTGFLSPPWLHGASK